MSLRTFVFHLTAQRTGHLQTLCFNTNSCSDEVYYPFKTVNVFIRSFSVN